jgi:hypothetical protein
MLTSLVFILSPMNSFPILAEEILITQSGKKLKEILTFFPAIATMNSLRGKKNE